MNESSATMNEERSDQIGFKAPEPPPPQKREPRVHDYRAKPVARQHGGTEIIRHRRQAPPIA